MTDDDWVLRLLTEVLDGPPKKAPDRLLASVLAGVGSAPQRRRWAIPKLGDRDPRPSTFRVAGAGLLVAVVAIVALIQLAPRSAISTLGATASPSGGSPSPATSATASPSPSPSPSATPSGSGPASVFPGGAIALEDLGRDGRLSSGVTYTSRLFEPRVSFRLMTRDGYRQPFGAETDVCSPVNTGNPADTSSNVIVLRHPKMCAATLSIVQPWAVDCGTPDAHPDATTLAAALLADPGLGASDLGGPGSVGALLPGTLLGDVHGRVLKLSRVGGGGAVAPPRGCRLLSAPGNVAAPIDIPGDIDGPLVLLDVDGKLVVMLGTGVGAAHLFTHTYDIAFGSQAGSASTTRAAVSYLPDGVEVVVPSDLRMSLKPAVIERMALDHIRDNEKTLGRALAPARILRIVALPAGATYPATRRDGTNPDRGGLGPSDGPGWAVVAEGTFVGIDHQAGKIVSHGTYGYFGFGDIEDGGYSRIFIPCWVATTPNPADLEGSCP
jgi:hypothetical protein